MTRAKWVACPAAVVVALATWSDAGAKPPTPAPAASAASGEGAPDVKAMIERNKKCLGALSGYVSKVSYGRKDVETYLAQWPSFDAFDDEDGKERADELPECVDLPKALANPRYVSWARERSLDPKDWLLKSLRISLTHVRWRAPAEAAEMKAQLEAQRRDLEQRCKSMGPDACRDIRQAFAGSDEFLRETAAMIALFPEPTASEAALLREYDGRLREATDGKGRHDRRRGGGLYEGDEDGAGPDAGAAGGPEDEDAGPDAER